MTFSTTSIVSSYRIYILIISIQIVEANLLKEANANDLVDQV